MERSPPQQGLRSPAEQSEEQTDQKTENRHSDHEHSENFLIHDTVKNSTGRSEEIRDKGAYKGKHSSDSRSNRGWFKHLLFPRIRYLWTRADDSNILTVSNDQPVPSRFRFT